MLSRDYLNQIMLHMLHPRLKVAPKERKRLLQKQRQRLERSQHQSKLEKFLRELERSSNILQANQLRREAAPHRRVKSQPRDQ